MCANDLYLIVLMLIAVSAGFALGLTATDMWRS